MLYIIVGIIVMAAAIVIYGSVMRRRIFKQIDRFESWKIDIMNRPVTEQIARIKDLKMVGETEKKFEIWRSDWDEIITTELPLIEEKLFDAEEYADRFQFKKAQSAVEDIQRNLEIIENQISEMLKDLNEVVESEEKNRQDIVSVKEQFHSLKKDLITKRPLYKDAGVYIEGRLLQIETDLSHYEQQTNEGNVIKAREILVSAKEQLDELTGIVEEIPDLYRDILTVLPKQIADIENGISDMVEEGYSLEHLNLDEQIAQFRKHIQLYEESMKKAEYDIVKEGLQNTFEQVEWIYNRLEKEVESRKLLREDTPIVRRDLEIVGEKIKAINKETEIVKQSYLIEEEDLRTQSEIDQTFKKLEQEFNEVDKVLGEKKQAFSIIHEKIEDMREHIEVLRDSVDQFKELLTNLRKDELLAKETLQQLRETLLDARRKVRKSNLPGIPNAYLTIVEDGEEILGEVSHKLDMKPLEMQVIHQLLDEAREKIALVNEKTDEMVESAILTEQLIQYGNRYRSRYPELDAALREAEKYFRSYNYSEAVEMAAAAIYKIDPGVIKRFKVEIEEVV
ncbi:MAG: septation ring formation regulator EzrA [Tuberibacillus sp.]